MSEELASNAVPGFRAAVSLVADAARASKLWLVENGLTPTAADVVAMTGLIIETQARLARAEEMKAIEAQLEQADEEISALEE